MITTIRHFLAIVIVVSFVPAALYWYLVHPFAGFWRRVGVQRTYAVVFPVYFALMVGAWFLRAPLIGRDLGTNWLLIAIGLGCYAVNIAIERACRRHLTFRTLMGVPEIEGHAGEQRLLREGIYHRVRHPRYLGLLIGLFGFALLVNHAGVYVCVAAFYVLIYGVILMEERELVERFGDEYRGYMRDVPRLVPRRAA